MGDRYARAREWADRFDDPIIAWLGEVYGQQLARFGSRLSTVDEDCRDGVDFLGPHGVTYGFRVRRHNHPKGDITIRLEPDRNGKRELDKIMEQKIGRMIYAHASNSDSATIDHAVLVDLSAVKRAAEDWFSRIHSSIKTHYAHDSGARFMVIPLDALESAYGPAIMATGSTTTSTTTTTDGFTSTTTTHRISRTDHGSRMLAEAGRTGATCR